MRARLAFLVLAAVPFASAEIIDRIAITIGDHVVTERQITDEIRVAAFLNRTTPDLSPAAKQTAAQQLIRQELIRREMESTHYPLPDKSEALPIEKNVIDQFGGEQAYASALARYSLTSAQVRQQLWWQLTTLRFIEYRFKPAVHIPEAAVERYYQDQVEKWKAAGQKDIPSLDDLRESIEQILTAERVDRTLDAWLDESRKQVSVTLRKEAFE